VFAQFLLKLDELGICVGMAQHKPSIENFPPAYWEQPADWVFRYGSA